MASKRLPFDISLDGRDAVVIGGGESLTAEDCNHASESGAFLIGVNDAYRIAALDVLYASDHPWIKHHYDRICSQRHLVVTQAPNNQDPIDNPVYYVEGVHGHSMSSDVLNFGGNSGFAAVHLASMWGAGRILLLGFDMQTKSKKHWFGSHPKEMDREHGFAAWRENFRNANCPTPIINCSRATALDCFPRSTIQDEL